MYSLTARRIYTNPTSMLDLQSEMTAKYDIINKTNPDQKTEMRGGEETESVEAGQRLTCPGSSLEGILESGRKEGA